ncbi:hypothetical protein ACYPKM_01510 [Pseudomonas aeruginosa]
MKKLLMGEALLAVISFCIATLVTMAKRDPDHSGLYFALAGVATMFALRAISKIKRALAGKE